jgi:DNA/RNA endonuclease YhcR with UshA esterase domain
MKSNLAAVIAGIGLVMASATPLVAHHSFAAEFDVNKPVTLKGVVTRIEWTNPHAHVFLDVKDDRGTMTNWKFEMASPTVLVSQCGWNARLHVGDEVTVEGAMAKDGSTTANARVLTLADGRRVSAGSSGGDQPPTLPTTDRPR